ncbi:mismatch-specific DNA-glycosylase [Brevibacterium aurantiacum]|uniref:mismatch-specific DNA-glycosylase n=1 Tax=Brevibacterium aurantiacum TaxID=273384 RepID=UPI001C9231AB|nr:mismatch-specific DNA-glycosylase [Brevibacterium aurantiacum]
MIEESFISSRRPSPLAGRKPTKEDLTEFATDNPDAIDDVLPGRSGELSMLIVGINPGLWTAAVNAPFARPGNRFWPSLHQAGLTDHLVDASLGLAVEDEAQLLARGIGITNLVGRATARADELDKQELREGAARLVRRLDGIRPKVVAVAGITSFRIGYSLPKAHLGEQDTSVIDGWPEDIDLHVVPQPSGLNAHYQVPDLARIWRDVWESIED